MSTTKWVGRVEANRRCSVANALQTWDTDMLMSAIESAKRGGWLAQTIADELVSRGIGHDGMWVGVEKARRIWVDAS